LKTQEHLKIPAYRLARLQTGDGYNLFGSHRRNYDSPFDIFRVEVDDHLMWMEQAADLERLNLRRVKVAFRSRSYIGDLGYGQQETGGQVTAGKTGNHSLEPVLPVTGAPTAMSNGQDLDSGR
jgi:hypothetical protein